MFNWESLRVLVLGGAGQCGIEICRQLCARDVEVIFVHDLDLERAEEALGAIRAGIEPRTELVASAGDVFDPATVKTWEFVPADGAAARVCRPAVPGTADGAQRLEGLLAARLGAFAPQVVKESLIWNLVDAYRPQVVVDTVNTATVLGYRGDVIQSGRTVASQAHRIFRTLREDAQDPLDVANLGKHIERLTGERARATAGDLVDVLKTSVHMAAFLDTAAMIRFVQCLHALFQGGPETRVPEFQRYVKVHTTGLGGMGFNIRYTHGDTGEPGLSTKLLGKVCATGSFTQLLMTLAHTPGCDVRVVVPATLIGFAKPDDAVIRGPDGVALPLVDSRELVPCDGSSSLGRALEDSAGRVVDTGEQLEVPYLSSGENNPYGIEDISAITALGQMGCVTKEEVARATVECVAGDARYDVLTAMDSALLLPTQTAAVERDRLFGQIGRKDKTGYRLPSVSVGNLGPTIAKHLYEVEIIRAAFETVERVVLEADPTRMALRACSYLLEDREGAILRRQIVSVGIPIFLAKGPGRCGLLLGKRLLFPDPGDADALARPLDPEDSQVQAWLAQGWIDLTGPRMHWWHDRFREVLEALDTDRAVSRNWFDPRRPFSAGQFLAHLYSISGGQRKEYM
jgi:NAD(P)-dependent dehydrogenase (short-subunit alcohol dehydrogenase family)